ncbi:hypothetical protein DFH09DRAFT_1344070 [Mycena vulgaris]|nr:hypothetical protein DFH09DRAFT_1344070 [Mycena vulgaris]
MPDMAEPMPARVFITLSGPSFLNIVAAPVRRAVISPECETATVGASVGIDAARLKLGAINTSNDIGSARNLLEAQLSLLDAVNGVTEIADSSLNSAPPAPADANQRIVAGLQAAQGLLSRVFAFDNTTKAAVTAANVSIASALQNNLFALLASPLALPTTSSNTDPHTNIMAPIAPISLTAPAVASYATEIPVPHQPFKYESLCILLAVLLVVAIAVGISRVYEKAKKWREERDADDLEAASAHASFTPPSIAVPPPSFGFGSNSPSFHAEMEERRNRLTLDVPTIPIPTPQPPRHPIRRTPPSLLNSACDTGARFPLPAARSHLSYSARGIHSTSAPPHPTLLGPPVTPPPQFRPRYPALPLQNPPTLKSVGDTPPLPPARPAINA